MTTRLGLVLLGEVLFLACPAFAQRSARRHADNDWNEAKARQPATVDLRAAAAAALDRSGDRNDGERDGGYRRRIIYTRDGVIDTNEFDVSSRTSGWPHGGQAGSDSCQPYPGQAKKDRCPRSLRHWLLGRLLKKKGLKRHTPTIPKGPDWYRDERRPN
jgi:hypothetical protein